MSNDKRRSRRARVKSGEIPFEAIPHGLNGYRNFGCPCEVCVVAGREDNRAARVARRAQREAEGHVFNARAWTASEDALARRTGLTAAQVADLTGRTETAVHLRRMRLRKYDGATAVQPRWTRAEDAVLRRAGLKPSQAAALLPGRTAQAARARMYRLGIVWKGAEQ